MFIDELENRVAKRPGKNTKFLLFKFRSVEFTQESYNWSFFSSKMYTFIILFLNRIIYVYKVYVPLSLKDHLQNHDAFKISKIIVLKL